MCGITPRNVEYKETVVLRALRKFMVLNALKN